MTKYFSKLKVVIISGSIVHFPSSLLLYLIQRRGAYKPPVPPISLTQPPSCGIGGIDGLYSYILLKNNENTHFSSTMRTTKIGEI